LDFPVASSPTETLDSHRNFPAQCAKTWGYNKIFRAHSTLGQTVKPNK
jgi:hypothetical protein